LSVLGIPPSKCLITFYSQTVIITRTYLFNTRHYLFETVTVLSWALTDRALVTLPTWENVAWLVQNEGMVPSAWYFSDFRLGRHKYSRNFNISIRLALYSHLSILIRAKSIQLILFCQNKSVLSSTFNFLNNLIAMKGLDGAWAFATFFLKRWGDNFSPEIDVCHLEKL
jgi:hypothetical protein